jgi:hypothetical protein
VKVTLLKDKSIKGLLTEAGTIVDVGDLVGQSLIDNGDAEIVVAKPKKKKATDK